MLDISAVPITLNEDESSVLINGPIPEAHISVNPVHNASIS